MYRLTTFLTLCLALFALCSPSFAAGVCIAYDGVSVASVGHDGPAHVPSPCELQGGKRTIPAQVQPARAQIEVPRATSAQWALGLADQPMRQGRASMAELPPPRLG